MPSENSKGVTVTPVLVEQAKLAETINDRLGLPTSEAVRKIARAVPAGRVRTA